MVSDHNKSAWTTNIPVQRKLLLAFGSMLLLIVANAIAFFIVQQEQRDARTWTIHTYQVLDDMDELLIQVLNQQTGIRGYALEAQDSYLDPYREGEQKFRLQMDALLQQTRDNSVQSARLTAIDALMKTWHDNVAMPVLELMKDPATRGQAAGVIQRGRIVEVRTLVKQMRETEELLLKERSDRLSAVVRVAFWLTVVSLILGIVLVLLLVHLLQRVLTRPLVTLTGLMTQLSDNDQNIVVPDTVRKDEIGALARALQVFKTMVINIQQQSWIKSNAAEISSGLQAVETRQDFANALTAKLSPLLGAGVAVFYEMSASGEALELFGSYGYLKAKHGKTRYQLGEGLVGQCARDRIPLVITDIPEDYVRIHSGTGEASPRTVLLLPVQVRDAVLGVLEFGTFGTFNERHQALLNELLPVVALSLENLQRALRTQELLAESQALSEELQASTEELRVQQEELRTTNETLYSKSQALQEQSAKLVFSEQELRVQAEELRVSNEELQLKGNILGEQKQVLEQLQAETEEKAQALARASQYKSEFLANMSHELRTPLNSLLILSRGLADNEEGHLNADEVESATVIHESGSNLLRLINDILDLSKVESGKMELMLEPMSLRAFATGLSRSFRHVAKDRGLGFDIEFADDLPTDIVTDSGKLEQIANNLLSNAFKFTKQGSVRLKLSRAATETGRTGDIAIQVIDTGIGIPKEKFDKVFQAFEQVDGSTSRQFGGTGLGLSIARGMAQLLGGDIRVESTPDEGTTFTLLVPVQHGLARTGTAPESAAAPAAETHPAPRQMPRAADSAPQPQQTRLVAAVELPDDRQKLQPGDTVILIIEDDTHFARILIDLVRRKGYRALCGTDGESGLKLAIQHRPTGILLDVMLPGMDGFSVIERLKADSVTRHIPVHFISATEDRNRGLDLGAVGFLTKPVSRESLDSAFERLLHFSEDSMRRVLVVDDDAASRMAVRKLVSAKNIEVVEASNGRDALQKLETGSFDCVVLDLGMPDMNGFEFLERAALLQSVPPVVVYSGRELSNEENLRLRLYTDSIVIKGARSPERLLDEVSLFLHSIRDTPAVPVPEKDRTLNGRVVLLVDDDMRNIFALSKALRAKGLTVVMAQDGYKAIKQLEDNRAIELVLMDIMMPGMDGYQTMGEIRKNAHHKKLPIIALTAKAMSGDREKCLDAGANDYLSKPIDLDKLFSIMRVWLSAPR